MWHDSARLALRCELPAEPRHFVGLGVQSGPIHSFEDSQELVTKAASSLGCSLVDIYGRAQARWQAGTQTRKHKHTCMQGGQAGRQARKAQTRRRLCTHMHTLCTRFAVLLKHRFALLVCVARKCLDSCLGLSDSSRGGRRPRGQGQQLSVSKSWAEG